MPRGIPERLNPAGYKCRYCDYVGKTPGSLGSHLRSNHPDKCKPSTKAYKKWKGNNELSIVNAVNFCPNCGCNIKAVIVALNLPQL